MFFFAVTSQLVGIPFMLDTMLRSAVPPHIGQTPEPGSEAETLRMQGEGGRRKAEGEGRMQNAVSSTAVTQIARRCIPVCCDCNLCFALFITSAFCFLPSAFRVLLSA